MSPLHGRQLGVTSLWGLLYVDKCKLCDYRYADAAFSYLRKFVDGTKFRELEPHQEPFDRGSCLTNPGHGYVVYLSGGGRVSLDLSAPSGVMQA